MSWMNFLKEGEQYLSALLKKDIFVRKKNQTNLMNKQQEIDVDLELFLWVACAVSQLLCL